MRENTASNSGSTQLTLTRAGTEPQTSSDPGVCVRDWCWAAPASPLRPWHPGQRLSKASRPRESGRTTAAEGLGEREGLGPPSLLFHLSKEKK